MSFFSYIFCVILFVAGVVAAYVVPDNTLALHLKFVLVGAWGAVMGLIFYSLCCRKLREAEENYTELLNTQSRSPKTEYVPVVPSIGDEMQPFERPTQKKSPFDSILPPGAVPAAEALRQPKNVPQVFPLEAWNTFCKQILKNRPFELSGGMNQRIAIAAAMMFEPRLLLCDEATSALDVTTAGAVVEELLKIRKTNGTSILLVTHHLGIARKMADNIGIMKDGRLIEYGSTDKIFDSPENEYTKKLIRDVPRLKK